VTEDSPGTDLTVSPAGLKGLTAAEQAPYRKLFPGDPDWGEVPDWVMVGLSNNDGGVRLFASRTLTQAGLQRRVDGFTRVPVTGNPNGPVARVPNEIATVVAVMKDFTSINAASYPDALRSLMELWSRVPTLEGEAGRW
jgi:hypothetical protein